jgi:hypothetical protein
MAKDDAPNYPLIAESLSRGKCVPFLGAGASIGAGFLSGTELASYLAEKSGFPDKKGRDNLAMLASYYQHGKKTDWVSLIIFLRTKLLSDVSPLKLHQLLVNAGPRLIVTTNYDDLIERAFADKPHWTVVDRGRAGFVWYRKPGEADWHEIGSAELKGAIEGKVTILYKMHGSLDRDNDENDFFLITEEDYVDFLGRPTEQQIPPAMIKIMETRNILFLGYALKDWNVRVMLQRISKTRGSAKAIKSWAIMKNASRGERELARAHDIDIYNVDLAKFAERLGEELQKLAP